MTKRPEGISEIFQGNEAGKNHCKLIERECIPDRSYDEFNPPDCRQCVFAQAFLILGFDKFHERIESFKEDWAY